MKYQQLTLAKTFATLAEAEAHLAALGWQRGHYIWFHPDHRGVTREIRRPNQGRFTIVTTTAHATLSAALAAEQRNPIP